ncbi:YaaL family protein [Alkalihalobacillus sp. MEB130]|uniref:YaaL family protein n=1 Tax=Alkalihalobacillus sp. MEB130 TaxID=2976704 RepID=UPI0028DD4974|nr:YaaL family protein [Alkalihalobacillus sp. MEB130]MDT8862962.1 YaaL family protein [Alkalihalobacillus sp. MEB130]
MFRRKQKLRKLENALLLTILEDQKMKLDSEKQLIKRSIDPSEDVQNRTKVTESIYSFLLREARERQINKNELR